VTTTTKEDRYSKAKHNIILTKVLDETTWTHLL
jgi:hypothetical protein